MKAWKLKINTCGIHRPNLFKDVLPNLICIEGIDGCGKDTQLNMLKDDGFLIESEPDYESPIGVLTRKVLSKDITLKDRKTIEYLFCADRNEHVAKICERDRFTISGRYKYSGLAYAEDDELVSRLNSSFPNAGFIIYLDLPPEEAMERISSRGEKLELYETLEKLKETHKRYSDILDNLPSNVKVVKIDATLSISEIHDMIIDEIGKYKLMVYWSTGKHYKI